MKRFVLIIFIILFSAPTYAQYRVYQYLVTNLVKSAIDQPNAKLVTSSLNPRAYSSYNGGKKLIHVELVRTWICPGDTSKFEKICPSPYNQIKLEDLL